MRDGPRSQAPQAAKTARKPTPARRRIRRRRARKAAALKRLSVLVRPDQHAALLRAARHRALVRARAVSDTSEIVREALDAWLAWQG